MGSVERLVRACLRGGWNKVVKNVEGSQAARRESKGERKTWGEGRSEKGGKGGKEGKKKKEDRKADDGGGGNQGIAMLWWCVLGVLCLPNPFRESAERGTQTSEWGKNSVSLPVLHPPPHARSIPSPASCARYHSLSLSLSRSLSIPFFSLSPFLVMFLSAVILV